MARRPIATERMAIVGHGIRLVPVEPPARQIAVSAEAAFAGLAVGALAMLVVALLDLGTAGSGLSLPAALATGGACGILGALPAHMAAIGRRMPGAEGRLIADRFDIVADREVAEKAASVIEHGPSA